MKLSPQAKAIIKSYLRGVVVAVTPLLATANKDAWAYVAAVFAGVIAPAIRAYDKNDPAFGAVAEIAIDDATKAIASKETPAA